MYPWWYFRDRIKGDAWFRAISRRGVGVELARMENGHSM